jgi:adenylate cyclase class IV
MVEARAIISDIEKTKKKLENLGAVFQGDYIFKDIIFITDKKNYDLHDGYLRLRVYTKNNWPTKNYLLVKKQSKSSDISKNEKKILKKEFDSENEALNFINTEFYDEFKRDFEYSRKGWQYKLENSRIFIEDIENFKPTIEIEGEAEQKLELLFKKIGIVEKLNKSIPEIMARQK